jgi:predicted CoA-binding protein
MKKTVIVGATPNTSRYAYLAAQRLTEHNHKIVPIGIKKGTIFGEQILPIRDNPVIEDVHTITLYLGPGNQEEYYSYLLSLNPSRFIFNPGTENEEFINMVENNGIEAVVGCTLVMLSINTY